MNKKLARICIYACVVLLALYVAKADEDFMLLYDFETPEQVQRFKGLADNKNSFTLVTAPEYTGSGQGAACFYAPPSGTGEHFWPRADGPVPEGKRDWGLYDELKMTIINPKDSDGKMGMNLYTASGIKIPYYSVPIPPGRSEFVWTLPDMAKGEDIVRIQFATSGTIERIVYLDDIRVTVSDASIITRLDALKKRMLREASPELWERAKMTEEIAALHTKIEAIGASGERPLQRAKQSQELLDSYLNLKKQLWATLCTQAVEKFDQAYPAEQVWGWGWTNGSQKVYRDDLPFLGEIGGRPLVKLARREREGVQLVLRSRSNLNNVQVSVIQPSIPGGKLHVTPLLVGHVKPPKPAYPVEYAQWHPDPLLPFVNGFELEANCWQAIWLDVRAVSDCPSGEYTFTFIAKAKNAPEIQVPVAVKVWGFELPKFPTQPSLVNYHSDGNITTYLDRAKRDKVYAEFRDYRRGKIAEEKISEDSKMLRRMEIATQDLLLEHNVTPAPLYVIHRRLIISDVQRWHDQGGKYFSITYLPPQKCDPGGPFESWVERLVLSNLAAQIPALK
ncbi:MAG TPA: hypothetical protein PKY10_05665, partial [Lentisphaeria bacterium]|nr:hypothetical protein [Lentisphaeria bacterium]